MRFQHKVAIVTGGAAGIGKACVLKFLSEGGRVAFFDVDQPLSTALIAEHGDDDRILHLDVDISDQAAVREAISQVVGAWGRIDVLVNNARASVLKSLDATPEDWELMLRVNIAAQAYVAEAVVQQMKRTGGGAIVNLGSISGVIAQKNQLTYNVTKAAMISMSKCLALDLRDDNIRVNTVSPGWVMTENVRDLLYTQWGLDDAEIKERIGNLHLSGRLAEPYEIANAVFFMASDEASFVNGANLMVDGGYTAV